MVIGGALALAGPASAAPSFEFSPSQPLTNEPITFAAVDTAGPVTWDFDGDQTCEADLTGASITRAFPTAGQYPVTMCAPPDKIIRTITVLNRPPAAAFTLVPAEPVARQPVVLTSTAVDPDGPIVAQEWDLDGDGFFDDATGETALYFWRRAGTYPVALRVTDRDGASSFAQTAVLVAPRPPGQFSPAPVVRVVGSPTALGARLSLLTVTAPEGAHVGVRCKGRNCPYKRKRVISKGGRIMLRAMQRGFRAGAVIEIRVTRPETIGKYTRLRIRAGERPARVDRCLEPGKPNKPFDCPLA